MVWVVAVALVVRGIFVGVLAVVLDAVVGVGVVVVVVLEDGND